MYSPDGFASLACALHHQCFFLGYQNAFIQLMLLLNKNIYFFFGLQIIVWLTTISLIYFLAKELKIKHLFLTPIILLFSTSFFVDNFVGSFENDCIGIMFILIGMIFFYKKNYVISLTSFLLSLTYWLWIGYLIRIPMLHNEIVEVMFWTHSLQYMFLFPIIIACIISGLKYKDKIKISTMLFILFFPKLFIFGVPTLLKFIDEILDKMLTHKKFIITILIIGLLLGQTIRVGLNTYNSWNRTVEDENCVTVNDEYFLRATKGLNYTYNQIDTQEVKSCKIKKSD
jgi:hypothetical protein